MACEDKPLWQECDFESQENSSSNSLDLNVSSEFENIQNEYDHAINSGGRPKGGCPSSPESIATTTTTTTSGSCYVSARLSPSGRDRPIRSIDNKHSGSASSMSINDKTITTDKDSPSDQLSQDKSYAVIKEEPIDSEDYIKKHPLPSTSSTFSLFSSSVSSSREEKDSLTSCDEDLLFPSGLPLHFSLPLPESDITQNPNSSSTGTKVPSSHKSSSSGTARKYQCDVCSKWFVQSCSLTRHKRIHSGERPYTCGVCAKTFTLYSGLHKHKRTHTGEKPHQCEFCGNKFSQKDNLQAHVRTHTGFKPYKCDQCEKSFFQSSNLQTHKISHTGEKAYKCDLCDKAYSQSSGLNKHKLSHSDIKPFVCGTCGKKFTAKGDLQRHERCHTGEKPFQCNYCDKRFSQTAHVKKHERLHTGDK